jgi:hypothetical protein
MPLDQLDSVRRRFGMMFQDGAVLVTDRGAGGPSRCATTR